MCVKSGRETSQEIYVVSGLHQALLGRPAIAALRLVARVGAVEKDGCTDATEPDLENLFPQLFTGLGNLEGEYAIKLREDVKPFAITTPRRVPIPLMPAVQEELARMEKLGVISKVEEPTDWCAGMVVVPKPDGRVRICVDLVRLNESVCREYHQMPTVEQVLAQVPGAQIFSKLDANSGFWQVPLSKESALLTTFSTPFGRYHFNRLPFGITSASEHFQRKMSAILEGLDGVVGLVDDVLVHGKDRREHDERLLAALRRLVQARLTLNKEKCSFFQTKVKFLGQILSGSGIESDPEKTAAITKFKEPANVSETRRFLGMVNQLSKFVPHLADMTKPLWDLLSKKNSWSWESPQQEAFQAVKQALTESPILALYDPSLETTVTADASSYGLGTVLRQKQADGITRPVAYVSRSMTPTEERYAQIEKEALALTWACERFSDYLIGLHFCVETDHKPLVPLFSQKLLDELPIRIQRFRMRMMRFSFSICHVPGKELATADALSRAPIDVPNSADHLLQDECDAYVQYAIQCLPATEKRLDEKRARQSVWWPGMSQQLQEYVTRCLVCCKHRPQRSEPLIPTSLPGLPWQRVGTDLFEWKKSNYLLVVDYYSRWIEIARLERTTAECVIAHTSSLFARHGIPEVVISDNGPQYTSAQYAQFAKDYDFRHITSSPYHPQGNGEAERAVQTVKNLLKKSNDPYMALLAYRATPLEVGYSPSELLMCRKLRTTVPTVRKQREPHC